MPDNLLEDLDETRAAGEEGEPRGLARRIQWAVCLATVVFNTCFAVLTIVTLCGIVFITRPQKVMHDLPPWAWLPLLIVMTPAQVYSQFLAWSTIATRTMPTGPAIAARQIRFPSLIRPFVALVWLVNFLLGFGIVVSLSKPNPGRPLAAADVPLIVILTFWLTFAANVYLLLAAHTLTNDRKLLDSIWRRRVVIDIAIALFAAAYYHL